MQEAEATGGVIASVMLMACESSRSWVEGPDLKYPGADKPQRMRSGGLSQTLQLLGNASSSWRSPRTRTDESGGGLVLWDSLLIRYFSGSARDARQGGALAQCVHRNVCIAARACLGVRLRSYCKGSVRAAVARPAKQGVT